MEESLTTLLRAAADGKPGAARDFFGTLLTSSVVVPLQPGKTEAAVSPVVGEQQLGALGYIVVHYQGCETLPIFTEPGFVADWAGEEIGSEQIPFTRLLHWLPPTMWLYVNPGQDVGKELTPWEIATLKEGEEAIPDLVAALDEAGDDETFIINSASDLFPELKDQLRPILEIYPELEEAFLITMQEGDTGSPKPVLGIKYGTITEAKRIYLRSEFENASAEFLPGETQLMIVEDLGNPNSPNHRLFAEATPFYFAPRTAPLRVGQGAPGSHTGSAESGDRSPKSSLMSRLKGILTRRDEKN